LIDEYVYETTMTAIVNAAAGASSFRLSKPMLKEGKVVVVVVGVGVWDVTTRQSLRG